MLPEFPAQVVITFFLLRPHEVNFPRLLRISSVTQFFVAELLTRQVESVIVNNVVAMEISAGLKDSEYLSAENVLCQE